MTWYRGRRDSAVGRAHGPGASPHRGALGVGGAGVRAVAVMRRPGARGAAEVAGLSPARPGTPYWIGVAPVDRAGNRAAAAIVGPITPAGDQLGPLAGPTPGQGNLALGNKTADNSYNLGQGNLALGNQGQMQNFYTANRGLDYEGLRTGAQLMQQGTAGEWAGIQNANGVYNPYTGYATQTSTSGGTNYAPAISNGLSTYQYLNAPK